MAKLLVIIIVSFIVSAAHASGLEQLERWAEKTFWGHYVSPESLTIMYRFAIARDDWQIAAYLAAGHSYVKFRTIDSSLFDISYCLAKSGDLNGAKIAIDRAAKIFGEEDPQTAYMFALIESYSGNFRRAKKIINSAIDLQETTEPKMFLMRGLGIIETFAEQIQSAMKEFQQAEGISKEGSGTPRFEARIEQQEFLRTSISTGTLYIRENYGRPCILLNIKPIFQWNDGSTHIGLELHIEQIAQIFGSPYFQRGIEREGDIIIPRWGGVPMGGKMSLRILYVDARENFDSCDVVVVGNIIGLASMDSLAAAIADLRAAAIKKWFDSLMTQAGIPDEPFWRLALSYRLAFYLSDTNQWDAGKTLADSLISVAPYIMETYLWRGAFALFGKNFDEAYQYFAKAIQKDSCYVQALYNAGVVKYLAGEYSAAEQLWNKAIRCDANFASPYMALGVLQQDVRRNPVMAREFYGRYIRLSDFLKEEVERWLLELK